jgi:hypothetical protein
MPKTTYANQRHVIISQLPRDKDNIYAMFNVDALNLAMQNLKHNGLRMWLYLNKNQNGYGFGLSPAAAKKAFGIAESSYHAGVNELIEKQYLVPDEESTNTYIFYEVPLSMI